MKRHVCREDYMWNPSKFASECNKICEIDE